MKPCVSATFPKHASPLQPADNAFHLSYVYMPSVCSYQLGDDGTVTNTFSHQCKLPVDVDPMSVAFTIESSGVLTVRANRVF